MRESWRLPLRNLARNKRRNLATGAAIGIGFAALLALGGYSNRVEHFMQVHAIYAERVGHLIIYKRGGIENYSTKPRRYSLDPASRLAIEGILAQVPHVSIFAAQLMGNGLIGNGCKSFPFIATSIDPEIDRRLREHPELQRWTPQFVHFPKGKGLWEYPPDFGAVALSEGLARLVGKPKVLSEFPAGKAPLVIVDCQSPELDDQTARDANVQLVSGSWAGGMSALDGEVVALYSTGISDTNSSALFTSLTHLQRLFGTDHVTAVAAWLDDRTALPEVMAELSERFRAAGLDLEVLRWDDERVSPMYKGTMDFLNTMVSFIASILGLIIVFSIFNAATITVIERSEEIGMMRSLGFSRAEIRHLYMKEVFALTLIALAMGGALGGVGILALNHANVRFHPPGVAGGMQLVLIPHVFFVAGAALAILLLSLAATYLAIRSVTARRIPILLSGAQR